MTRGFISTLWAVDLSGRNWHEFCRRRTIRNVSFGPYVPRDKLGASLAEGHIGLVTQNPATLGAVVPSKTYGLMAAGRPVLFIGPASGDAGAGGTAVRLRVAT